MMSLLVEDAAGYWHWSNVAMFDQWRQHPWLHGWEGVATTDRVARGAADPVEEKKSPSWFLGEWMRGEHDGGD
jgi:hypothetical protein